MTKNIKSNSIFDSYKSSFELKNDLNRLEDLRKTITMIMEEIDRFEKKRQKETSLLKDKIYQLTSKENYMQDEENQTLIKTTNDRISTKDQLFERRKKILENQLKSFKDAYNKLYAKEITVRCKDLKDELEKLNDKDIYINLSMGIISFEHNNLYRIMKEYKDRRCYIDMTISDKKNPEYCKELNDLLYSKRFPVNFGEIEYDGNILYDHISLDYGMTDDAKSYTYLKINDTDDICLKFSLGELTKEDSETWKPSKQLKESVCNCKDKEYRRNIEKQKTKRK